ncbi:hypothetical protein QR680_006115 [Steinernema hermaphroditum]|uniref:UV-stimulated scaffold protein A C-terminal domain-containing protein n=1 Tax=Steinernema hermaphroditum TaxID=289476 RepID=A0AA39HUB7_9BILA|nr:hypothetical protein QR680_006115 [Steinernema hermaphroditum]
MSVELAIAKRSLAGIVKDFDPVEKDISKGSHLKRLKDVIRRNEALIEEFVDSLFGYLRKDDCDRSHAFRLQIVEFLQDFLLCTVETDPVRYPLPLPNTSSKQLKSEALKIVKQWCEKFSPAYGKLRLANDFLKSSKSFDYERLDAAMRIERQRAEEERLRKEAISERVTEKVRSILSESEPEIRRTLRETKNAIELLYPKFVTEEEETEESEQTLGDRHLHGYYTGDEVKIVINPADTLVKEDASNKDLFESLRDCCKMLNCYLKAVTRWLQKLHKHMLDSNRDLIKTLVDLKNEIQGNIEKCKELKADSSKKRRRVVMEGVSESEEDDDDEFVDVEEKEGFEFEFKHDEDEDIPKHVLDRIARMEEKEKEDDSAKSGPSNVPIIDDEKPCCSKSIRPAVPTVSYGLDLKYWEEKDAKPDGMPKNVFDGINYWKQSDSDALNEGADSYQVRVMTFAGNEDDGPKMVCKTRMKNGKLCPRMDKKTCPFHGTIIPRDEEGFPMKENADAEAIEREKEREKKEDDEMVRDIEKATGVSLTGNKSPKKKKREVPASAETRDRLTKKLFDKKSLKRVTETLEAMKQSKMQRIHAHNWSHGFSK